MKEYILNKFQELSEEYLQENCEAVKEYASYGEGEACVSESYTDIDIQDSYNHAMDQIESEIKQALKELKEKYGVTTDQFLATVEKAKETLK